MSKIIFKTESNNEYILNKGYSVIPIYSKFYHDIYLEEEKFINDKRYLETKMDDEILSIIVNYLNENIFNITQEIKNILEEYGIYNELNYYPYSNFMRENMYKDEFTNDEMNTNIFYDL